MALSYLQIDPVYGAAISGEPYRETLSMVWLLAENLIGKPYLALKLAEPFSEILIRCQV